MGSKKIVKQKQKSRKNKKTLIHLHGFLRQCWFNFASPMWLFRSQSK